MHATYPAHLVLLDLIVAISDDEFESRNPSLFGFQHASDERTPGTHLLQMFGRKISRNL
jgi:hypothetical protein